jgi:hypothetical protein
MRTNNLEPSVIGRFLVTLKGRGTEFPYPQSGRPVLYLKCWGSDYPYLQGDEVHKNWLPVVVKSPPAI